jgi:hypothetical protein
VPSRSDVRQVLMTAESIAGRARPELRDARGQPVGWGGEAVPDAA